MLRVCWDAHMNQSWKYHPCQHVSYYQYFQTLTSRESHKDFVEPVCFSDGTVDRALHHRVHCWRQTCWMYSLQYTTLLLHNDLSHVERCRRSEHVHDAGQSDELSCSPVCHEGGGRGLG